MMVDIQLQIARLKEKEKKKKNLTECKSDVLNQRDVNNDEQAVILLPSAYITA